MFDWFRKKKKIVVDTEKIRPLEVDMHAHWLPGIDDGAATLEDSLELIRAFAELGYQKLVATPHIMGDFYRNTPEIIHEKLECVRRAVLEAGISMELEASAEYYLDESFMKTLRTGGQLLPIAGKYILFETSYMQESSYLNEAIFAIRSLGYIPVMAHPERYVYFFRHFEQIEELVEKEVLMQININSLTGYYSPDSQRIARQLIEKNMVSFLGSDCHNMKHLGVLQTARESSYYQLALTQSLLNNEILVNLNA